MSIKNNLEDSLKKAMKEKDEDRKRVIRMALSTIKFSEIEGKHTLDDNQIIAILQKEIKTRFETIEEAKKIDRQDLIIANQTEIQILNEYLPKQMNESEVEEICLEAIKSVEAKSLADMGKVMKVVLPKIEGRTSNVNVSKVVKRLLAS